VQAATRTGTARPSRYESTLGIVEEILGRGTVTFGYRVIPGSAAWLRSPPHTASG
jgi:hypothetical protein